MAFKTRLPTEAEIQYIKDNYENTLIAKLAREVHNSEYAVRKVLAENGLEIKKKKRKREKGFVPKHVVVFKQSPPEEKKTTFVRPPAIYSNFDWKKYGDELLNN